MSKRELEKGVVRKLSPVERAAMKSYECSISMTGDEYRRVENSLMLTLWEACARLARQSRRRKK